MGGGGGMDAKFFKKDNSIPHTLNCCNEVFHIVKFDLFFILFFAEC